MESDPFTSSLVDALDTYQSVFLAARNLAARTRREYLNDLSDLLRFLHGKCFVDDPHQVTRSLLETYLAELDHRGFRGSTRRRKVASIRSFFGYLFDHGVIRGNPAYRLIPPERQYAQPRVLTEGEYQRLLKAVEGDIRDGTLIELFLQTGMRLSEVANLDLSDIELPSSTNCADGSVGSVRIFGKGPKSRTITLNWKACRALQRYLQTRAHVGTSRLFITKFGAAMSSRAIQLVVEKYLKQANIRGASVSTLRHTFATHMVKKGTKLEVVRQALGLANLKTASIYVDLAHELMDKELQANAL